MRVERVSRSAEILVWVVGSCIGDGIRDGERRGLGEDFN